MFFKICLLSQLLHFTHGLLKYRLPNADGATGDSGVPPLGRGRSRQYFVLGAGIAAACCVGILVAWSAAGRQGYPAELLTIGDAYADVYRQVSAKS
jgi:hypothetical protein